VRVPVCACASSRESIKWRPGPEFDFCVTEKNGLQIFYVFLRWVLGEADYYYYYYYYYLLQ
jgi:hypothetical protein